MQRAVLYLPNEKGRGSLRQRCIDAGNPFIQTWLKRALFLVRMAYGVWRLLLEARSVERRVHGRGGARRGTAGHGCTPAHPPPSPLRRLTPFAATSHDRQDLLPCAGDITTAKNDHVIPGFTTQSNLQTAGVEAQQVL